MADPVAWRLALWACAAFTLAWTRVPFDDEWLSIELAFESTPAQFWFALEHDMHPPWVALVDRALGQPELAQALRIALSALAIGFMARGPAQALAVPRTLLPWAALQPIVLFYAGALRWYPYLWLAQALRASAIWQPRAARANALLFMLGAWLGGLASYVDVLFVVHDAAWWLARARAERRLRSGLVVVAIAGLGMLALRYLSPLQRDVHGAFWLGPPALEVRDAAQWLGLGLAGETALPWPWWIAGGACVLAAAWALARSLREPATRAASAWIVTSGLTWLVACGYGVWHPRYSLLLWALLPALAAARWVDAGRVARAVLALAAAHLAVGLALSSAGRGFFKADLNTRDAEDCAPLTAAGSPKAIVFSYGRLEHLFRDCRPDLPMVRVRSRLLVPKVPEQLAAMEPLWASAGEIWLLTSRVESSFGDTDLQLRAAALARGCQSLGTRAFGRIPHPGWTPSRAHGYRRFQLERFFCPGP